MKKLVITFLVALCGVAIPIINHVNPPQTPTTQAALSAVQAPVISAPTIAPTAPKAASCYYSPVSYHTNTEYVDYMTVGQTNSFGGTDGKQYICDGKVVTTIPPIDKTVWIGTKEPYKINVPPPYVAPPYQATPPAVTYPPKDDCHIAYGC